MIDLNWLVLMKLPTKKRPLKDPHSASSFMPKLVGTDCFFGGILKNEIGLKKYEKRNAYNGKDIKNIDLNET